MPFVRRHKITKLICAHWDAPQRYSLCSYETKNFDFHLLNTKATWEWEVGHTQSVSSRVHQICFQPDKVRLIGIGFNEINPLVLSITLAADLWEKNHRFPVPKHLDTVSSKHQLNIINWHYVLYQIRPFLKNGSFWCFIRLCDFFLTRELTNRGFLDMASPQMCLSPFP